MMVLGEATHGEGNYLEMLARSHRSISVPRDGLAVVHVPSPTVPYYRSLYNPIGRPYRWLSRRKMSHERLAAIISDARAAR